MEFVLALYAQDNYEKKEDWPFRTQDIYNLYINPTTKIIEISKIYILLS